MEEKLEEYKINITEYKYLMKVFEHLSSKNSAKYFTDEDIKEVFKKMNIKMTKK